MTGRAHASRVTDGGASPRWPALDGVRGISIVLVVLTHLQWRYARGGFVGVSVFFALSGFLITARLLDAAERGRDDSLRPFFSKRVRRLLPVLLALLAAEAATSMLLRSDAAAHNTRHALLIGLTFTADFARNEPAHNLGGLGHLWSIAIEAQFYVTWPPVLMYFLRRRVRPAPIAVFALAVAIASAAWRAALWGTVFPTRVYSGFDTRADALMLGAAAALLVHAGLLHGRRRQHPVVALAGLGGWVAIASMTLSATWLGAPMYRRGGFAIAAVASAAIVTASVLTPIRPIQWLLVRPTVRWCGTISYSLYMWHYLFVVFPPWGHRLDHNHPALWAVAASLVTATVSYYALERPFLRSRVERARPSAPADDRKAAPPPFSAHPVMAPSFEVSARAS